MFHKSIYKKKDFLEGKLVNAFILVVKLDEASLKGFELPLSVGGPSNELDFYSIDSDEYPKIIELTKQALQELAGQDIPPEQFPEQITSLIKEKAKGVFPPEQLEDIGKIIEQGNKPSKQHKWPSSHKPSKFPTKRLGV